MRPGKLRLIILACVGAFLVFSCCSCKKQKFARKDADRALGRGSIFTKIERVAGSEARLGQVTGVIDAPRDRVWKVISDYNEQKNFMPNLLESFVIREEGLRVIEGVTADKLDELEEKLKEYKTDEVEGKVVYMYGKGDFPWPIPNKRYVLRIERDRDQYVTHSTMIIGEMKSNESSWELKPYGADGSKTLATYRLLLDPGMAVPGFVINTAASSTLPKVIEAVRKRVKHSKYNP